MELGDYPLPGGLPTGHEQLVPAYHVPRWRVRDRLSEADIATLIAAFKAGTSKRVLAERYGINGKSVKKLLREQGVKRKSRYDIQP